MRKLKLQMNMTIDGFVADPKGQLDWMLQEVDEKQVDYLQLLTREVDTIILGRKMATESIPHWDNVAKNEKKTPESEYAKFFVDTPKIIFSKTLKTFEGKNISVEKGSLQETITQLKSKGGKDIIVYGGASFVSSLINDSLIDEMNLFIHPTAIGNGLPIFNHRSKLKLLKTEHYSNGIVLLQYTPNPNNEA